MHGLLLQIVLSTVQEVEEHVGDYHNVALFKGNAHLTVNM